MKNATLDDLGFERYKCIIGARFHQVKVLTDL